MSGASIIAGASYLPVYGEPRRRGRPRVVCAADEDGVTLAVEAGERALARWAGDRADIDALHLAVQQGAELAGPFPQIIREALGLDRHVRVVAASADDLAALAALQAAVAEVDTDVARCALVIAADAATDAADRTDAGAAALIVAGGLDGVTITDLGRSSSLTHEEWFAVDGARDVDDRFVVHRQQALLADLLTTVAAPVGANGGAGRPDAVILSGVDRRLRAGIVAHLDPADPDATAHEHGVAGVAIAIVEAAARRPGATIALVAVGSGQAARLDVALAGEAAAFAPGSVAAEPPPPTRRMAMGPLLPLPLDSPFFARSWAETLRLEAGRCVSCGHVAFPPSQRPICPECRGREWEPHELPRTGRLISYLENRFLPAGFGDSIVFALAELDGGQPFGAPMPPEVGGADVAIGDTVRLVLRRFSLRDGLPVYSMKFIPVEEQS